MFAAALNVHVNILCKFIHAVFFSHFFVCRHQKSFFFPDRCCCVRSCKCLPDPIIFVWPYDHLRTLASASCVLVSRISQAFCKAKQNICPLKLLQPTLIVTPTLKVFMVSGKCRRKKSCPSVHVFCIGIWPLFEQKGVYLCPTAPIEDKKKSLRPTRTKKK